MLRPTSVAESTSGSARPKHRVRSLVVPIDRQLLAGRQPLVDIRGLLAVESPADACGHRWHRGRPGYCLGLLPHGRQVRVAAIDIFDSGSSRKRARDRIGRWPLQPLGPELDDLADGSGRSPQVAERGGGCGRIFQSARRRTSAWHAHARRDEFRRLQAVPQKIGGHDRLGLTGQLLVPHKSEQRRGGGRFRCHYLQRPAANGRGHGGC
mmetsp:Transcript_96982/g.279092  ORF Transcript_96982/g.279092 Transcript_96982/m.279092 type:complete len:209 (-) Transcript_96982:673-1299(-)